MSSGERCDACRFWGGTADASIEVRYKQCRRWPPVVRPSFKTGEWAYSEFPLTPSGAWCGEFEPRPSPKETGGG